MKSFKFSLVHLFRFYFIIITAIVLFLQSQSVIMCQSYKTEPPASSKAIYESIERSDILDEHSPEGLRIVQITTNPKITNHHLYPDSYMFTPDSKRFVFHRMGVNDYSLGDYWLCNIEDKFSLRQITYEEGIKGAAVSRDGKWMYYFVDRTLSPAGILKLKRVSLENFTRETLMVLDGSIPGTNYKPTRVYNYSSISSDSKRLCTSVFLGDGKTEDAPFGLLVFDLENLTVTMPFKEKRFINMHLQYCPSLDPVKSHDILIQHNHDNIINPLGRTLWHSPERGEVKRLDGSLGADLHVIRDDGTNWRDIPIGRDKEHNLPGNQAWRGRIGSVISAVQIKPIKRFHLFESMPIPTDESTSHLGRNIPGGKYNDITRNIEDANFSHLGVAISGMHLVARLEPRNKNEQRAIYVGTFSPGENAYLKVQYLLSLKSVKTSEDYVRGQSDRPRPFLSPDASMVFFQTNIDGPAQIFMVTGYKLPEF